MAMSVLLLWPLSSTHGASPQGLHLAHQECVTVAGVLWISTENTSLKQAHPACKLEPIRLPPAVEGCLGLCLQKATLLTSQ